MCHYSRAIMAYLVSKYARNDSLYPKDTKERAKVDQMMYFDGGTLWPKIFNCYVCIDFYSKILLINITIEFATFILNEIDFSC